MRNIHVLQENIYITNDEEIKDGDWYANLQSKNRNYINRSGNAKFDGLYDDCKKIILTTDQDLIKNGVQTIDDDFLEWFVNNPSCEEVEVVKTRYDGTKSLDKYWSGEYKIIIPKEEAKQDEIDFIANELAIEKEMFELEQELDIPSHLRWHNSKPKQEGYICPQTLLQCDDECCVSAEDCHIKEWTNLSEPKQETLEEIAERYYQDEVSINGFINGYKLAKEQTIYEVFEWLTTNNYLTDLKETMIKQFKNK
jgi:hypothetical protein